MCSTMTSQNGHVVTLRPSSLCQDSYTVGMAFQAWQNMNSHTIEMEMRASLFSWAWLHDLRGEDEGGG